MNPVQALFILRIVLAVLLYGFLAALLWIAWTELRAASREAEARSKQQGRLVVLDRGPLDGLQAGTTYPLFPLTTLGRAPTNTIPIPDETASLEHVRLALQGRQWWLEDLGSRNGTSLNGIPLTEATVLSSGDVIGVGRVLFRVEF